MLIMEYYVYVYLDTTKEGDYKYSDISFKYKPFYVGKGKNDRYLDHIKRINESVKNKHKVNTIKKILKETGEIPLIVFIEKNLSEKDSFILEKGIIEEIGIENLTNYHVGGNGGDTWSNSPNKEIIIEKISKTKQGKKYEDIVSEERAIEWKKKLSTSTKKRWEENREEIIKSLPRGSDHHMYGKTNTFKMKKESIDKIIISKTGNKNPNSKKYLIISPDGVEYIVDGDMRNFCKKKKLSPEMMYRLARKEVKTQNHHKGWKIEILK